MRKAIDEEAEGRTALDDAQAENRKVNESALQTKWGDKYQENVDGALKFRDSIMTHMPDEGKAFVEFLNDTKFGDNPQVVEFFSQCAGLISEDAIQRGSPRPTGTEVGRSESGDVILDDYADMDR
jgi:hypothetical protein